MIIEVFTIIYMICIIVGLIKHWKKLPKSAFTGFLSGVILLGYTIVLHTLKTLSQNAFIVVLAVTLIQLSAFEAGKTHDKINWGKHAIRLVIHIIIVYFMLKSK
ncbi:MULTISPECIES: hypothetical protein [unclassified Granulicatella]|uniref:hypothetical protein n=1 Tax=unclassified Granulicatella TaxID=2630493 RepID=UPI00107335EE|nr:MULTISPECIES: hypothetical protein [unclassified Granulicatella]MBF0779900.1 hypothetical protein [Granulicatella sp. 19428wC4_WM01]TFU96011.1 hypothetical protein E4T68_02210 [Granulicatella sp. WM01]